MEHIYDFTVIGGGPAGYTAALYGTRAGLDTLIIEKFSIGGQMTETVQIDNYPGFDDGVDGFTLGDKMKKAAEKFGAVTKFAEVLEVDLTKDIKELKTSDGIILSKTVAVATGAVHRHLGIDGEEKFIGKGVAYCAACDGMFYKGKTVAIVGGGNSAVADALVLSKICEKVILIHRRDSLRATKIYHDKLKNANNIEFMWNSKVSALSGDIKLKEITVENTKTGEITNLGVDGLFISIGRNPSTELFRTQLTLDEHGYIVADENTKTNIPGVFAIGDVRTKALRQIVTATADGAVAALFAEEFIG